MQTYAPAAAPRAAPVLAAHCGRSAPGSALVCPSCRRSPSPPSRIAPGMHHAPTDAGIPASPPAACRATPCPAEPRQRLAPLAFSPLLQPPSRPAIASPLRPSWHTPPSGACGSPLATVCPPGLPAPPPALAVGLRRLALRCSFPARPPATRPPRRWLPKSRRWRAGDLWISGLFSPSLHHECRSPGACRHKTTINQGMPLSGCRICYLLLTLFAPFDRLLPSSERGRQWHTFRSASTATALPRIGC